VRFYRVTIQLLVELIADQSDGVSPEFRPMEAVLFQAFEVQVKAIVFPEQDLDAIVIAVGEHIELCWERAALHGIFNDHGKTVDGFTEVHRRLVQINDRQ
jgi:hypothetical protein